MGFTVSIIDIKSAVLSSLVALGCACLVSLLYSGERAIFARMRRWRNLNNTLRTDSFSRTFYTANLLEIFERIAWYGFFTVSSLYMSSSPEAGGLGFSDTERGVLQGIIPFFVYVLPVVTGALGDRLGYRRMFLIAFAILTPSYFLLGQVHQFWPFFFVYMLVALGAAIFKPLVVGTVARSANEHNRGRAFGIFYMMVNVGGFLGPVIAGYVRAISWEHVFLLSSIAIGINLLIALVLLEDDTPRESNIKATSTAFKDAGQVLGNGRFALMLVPIILGLMVAGGGWISWQHYGLFLLLWAGIQYLWDRTSNPGSELWYRQPLRVGNAPFLVYLLVLSLFWAVYNQIFLTLPLYVQDFVDTSDVVLFVNALSPDFAHYLAPVDPSKIAVELGAMAANRPEVSDGLRQLAQFQIRVPEETWFSGMQSLRSGDTAPAPLASEWVSRYRQISPEYIISFDFLSIVLFQYFISRWGEHRAPFGILILGTGMIGLSFLLGGMAHMVSFGGLLAIASVVVFAFGEMFASPKSQEYVASVTPAAQAALFQGYYFVSIAIGYLLAGIMSGWAYGEIALKADKPFLMWAGFAMLAMIAMGALALFNRYWAPAMATGSGLGAKTP